MTKIELSNNQHFSGSINFVTALKKLKHMILEKNNFSGTLPNDFSLLTTLDHINLCENNLNIPINVFSKLNKLSYLNILSNNHVYGSRSWNKGLSKLKDVKMDNKTYWWRG